MRGAADAAARLRAVVLRVVVVVGAARAHVRERRALARLRVHRAGADVVVAGLGRRVDALALAVLARHRLERLLEVAVRRAAVAAARVVAVVPGAIAVLCLAAAHVRALAVRAAAVRVRGDLARVCGQTPRGRKKRIKGAQKDGA